MNKRRSSSIYHALIVLLVLIPLLVGGYSFRVPLAHAAGLPSFTGSSETTYLLPGMLPAAAGRIVGRSRVTSTWSIADATHWRLDSHMAEPPLNITDETVVANGGALVWYESIYNRALTMKLGAGTALGGLGMFQGGSLVGIIQSIGTKYFTYLKKQGGYVRMLRQEQVLGRTADVIELGPLYSGSSGGRSSTYGWARLWLDHQCPLVLRLELHGLGQHNDQPHHWVYRVTSLSVGQGPSPQALAYRPPVPAASPPSSPATTSGGSAGPGTSWQVPGGFIPAVAPAGYTLAGSSQDSDPLWGAPSHIAALFDAGSAFVYVQEQVRVRGLPAALMPGPPIPAGRCRVWTGQYPGKQVFWLALQHGRVSLLATSNSLSQPALIRYAAQRIC